jgi:hypothetical protein
LPQAIQKEWVTGANLTASSQDKESTLHKQLSFLPGHARFKHLHALLLYTKIRFLYVHLKVL